MGRVTRSSITNGDLPDPTKGTKKFATSKAKQQTARRASKAKKETEDDEQTPTVPANTSRKRARSPVKQESTESEAEPKQKPSKRTKKSDDVQSEAATPKKSASIPKSKKAAPQPDLEAGAKVAASISGESPKKPSKANPYQLSPGSSPYPNYPKPTPQDCQEVHDALAKIHGTVSAPKTISPPSLTDSGCGEVPSVLDALIRTRLSAATNGANSSRAFRGLVDRYGLLKSGTGKGSVDWLAVRNSPVSEVFSCIQSGGLADVKSRDIKKILDLVYSENEQQIAEQGEKGEPKVISLDHLHTMQSDVAFQKLLEYPGIGPKTASCVLLFCMQRPSFAVDTHVFRLTRWLGWTPSDSNVRQMGKEAKRAADAGEDEDVKAEEEDASATPSKGKKSAPKVKGPPPVTRNTTYAHLDIRIPDNLKYGLHYLFIKHGKTCPECSAKKDGAMKKAWGDKKCPLKVFKRGVSKKEVLEESGEVKDEESEEDDVKVEDDGEDGEEASDGEGKEKTEHLHGIERQMVL